MNDNNARGAGLSATVVAAARLEPALLELWRQWCAEGDGFGRAFLTPDFTLAVDAVRPGVRIAVIYQHGSPAAFLPFQFKSPLHRALGWAERIGANMADYFGIVCAPAFHTTAQALLEACGLNFFCYDHLEDIQLAHGLDPDTRRQTGLLIRIDDGPEAYWREMTAKDKDFVQDTVRREKQLATRVGPPRFELAGGSETAVLDHLIDAKRRQYQATGAGDALAQPWTSELLRHLHRTPADQCRPYLSSLHAGETWVASHFGLQFQDRLHYWFPVYNPELKRYAPGRLLLKATIDASREQGVRVIDRGEGESQAKLDFANDRHEFHAGLWRRSNPQAAIARVLNSLEWRMQALGRQRSGDR